MQLVNVRLVQSLATMALRQMVGERADAIVKFLGDQFGDRSKRVSQALRIANERSWRSVEITLAGSSWWERCKVSLASGEEKAFRRQVQAFIEAVAPPELAGFEPAFREQCLRELQAAQKAGLIPGGQLTPEELTAQVRSFENYVKPESLLAAEIQALTGTAIELERSGYPRLARFISIRPADGPPLLVIAVRYFFRWEIENDPKLAAGLMFQQMEGLSTTQEAGFQSLNDGLVRHGKRLETLLNDVQDIAAETRDDLRDVKAEFQRLNEHLKQSAPNGRGDEDMRAHLNRQDEQLKQIYHALLGLMERPRQKVPESVPCATVTSAQESDQIQAVDPPTSWQQVRNLVAQCRSLSKEKQRQVPALFRALGKLKAKTKLLSPENVLSPGLVEAPDGCVVFQVPPTPPPFRATEMTLPGEPETVAIQPATLRRVQGSLVSSLFQTSCETANNAKGEVESTPPSISVPPANSQRNRLVSPIFLRTPHDNPSQEPEK